MFNPKGMPNHMCPLQGNVYLEMQMRTSRLCPMVEATTTFLGVYMRAHIFVVWLRIFHEDYVYNGDEYDPERGDLDDDDLEGEYEIVADAQKQDQNQNQGLASIFDGNKNGSGPGLRLTKT